MNGVVFIDQSGIKLEPRPLYGLSTKGKRAKIIRSKPESYQQRYDVMRAILGKICLHSKFYHQKKERIVMSKDGESGWSLISFVINFHIN